MRENLGVKRIQGRSAGQDLGGVIGDRRSAGRALTGVPPFVRRPHTVTKSKTPKVIEKMGFEFGPVRHL